MLLEDAEDLPGGRRIARVRREKGRQRLPVVPRERNRVHGDLAQNLCVVTLQEASSHTLRDSIDGGLQGSNVRRKLPRFVTERRSLLLALLRRSRNGLLGRLAVGLVLHEVGIELRLLGGGLLDARLDLRNLVAQVFQAGGKLTVVFLTVAQELLVEVLVLLALLGHFRLHLLQQVHDAANRVLAQFALVPQNSC